MSRRSGTPTCLRPITGPGGRNLYNISTRRSELPDTRIFINNQFQPIGQSEYDGLLLELRQRFNNRLQFDASWTLSHAIDYIPDAIFDIPYASDQNNLEADRGNSLQHQWHKLSFSGVLVTPAASNGGLWRVLGDMNVAPIVSLGSPFFNNITTGTDSNGDGVLNDRPIGAGRNTYEGDTISSVDLRITRAFSLGGTAEAAGHRRRVQHLQHRELHDLQHGVGCGGVPGCAERRIWRSDLGGRPADHSVRDPVHVLRTVDRASVLRQRLARSRLVVEE